MRSTPVDFASRCLRRNEVPIIRRDFRVLLYRCESYLRHGLGLFVVTSWVSHIDRSTVIFIVCIPFSCMVRCVRRSMKFHACMLILQQTEAAPKRRLHRHQKPDFWHTACTTLEAKHTPRKTPIEQATQSSSHTPDSCPVGTVQYTKPKARLGYRTNMKMTLQHYILQIICCC